MKSSMKSSMVIGHWNRSHTQVLKYHIRNLYFTDSIYDIGKHIINVVPMFEINEISMANAMLEISMDKTRLKVIARLKVITRLKVIAKKRIINQKASFCTHKCA